MNDFIELIKPRKWIFLGLVIVFLGLVYAAFSLENDEKNDAAFYENLKSDLIAIQAQHDEAEIGLFCDVFMNTISDSFYLTLTLVDESIGIGYPSVQYFRQETFSTSDDIYLKLTRMIGEKNIRMTPQEIKIDSIPLYIFKNLDSVYSRHFITLNRADLSIKLKPDIISSSKVYELSGKCTQIPTKVIYDIERENNSKVTEKNIL